MPDQNQDRQDVIKLPPRAAISLTYDGGDSSHLEVAVRHLSDAGLFGTFYVPASVALRDLSAWKAVSWNGHEIGNGALLDIDLFSAEDLDGLTNIAIDAWREDQSALQDTFGDAPQSYALPWADDSLPDLTTVRNVLQDDVPYVRSGIEGWNLAGATDLRCVHMIMAVDYTAEQLIALTELAMARRAWAVFAFKGVGVGHPGIDAVSHREWTEWLRDKSGAWIAPFSEVAEAWISTLV